MQPLKPSGLFASSEWKMPPLCLPLPCCCVPWLAWPSIRGLSNGDGVVLASFGAPLLVLIWGIFVQDLTLDDGAARSRVASATSIAWPR